MASLWLYEGDLQPHKKERLLPDGSMDLAINLNEDQTRSYDPHDTDRCVGQWWWERIRNFSRSTRRGSIP